MKKFMNWALTIVLAIIIGSATFGIGKITYTIYENSKNTEIKLEQIHQQTMILLNIIYNVSVNSVQQNETLTEKTEILKEENDLRFQTLLSINKSIENRNRENNKKLIKKIADIHYQPSYEYLKNVTVRIFREHPRLAGYGWVGTGTIVKITDDYSYILTNKHVAPINSKTNIYVGDSKEELIQVEVVKNSAFEDLSLIRIVGKIKGKQVINGMNQAYPSDKVYSVGMYLANYYIYTEGTFAGNQENSILINAPTSFGCSGSGVFDRAGSLVAVIHATNVLKFIDTDSSKAVCVPISAIRLFLEGIYDA